MVKDTVVYGPSKKNVMTRVKNILKKKSKVKVDESRSQVKLTILTDKLIINCVPINQPTCEMVDATIAPEKWRIDEIGILRWNFDPNIHVIVDAFC